MRFFRGMRALLLLAAVTLGCARETPPAAPYYAPPYGYAARGYGPALQPAAGYAGAPVAGSPMPPMQHSAVPAMAPEPATAPPPWYPEGSTRAAQAISGGPACLASLDARGVRYQTLAERRGVDTPVAASSPLGGIQWRVSGGGPLVADCRLVVALAQVGPELSALGVTEGVYSGAYSYRFTRTGRLSLHGRGLAIDVHEIVAHGQRLSVVQDFARGAGDGCAPASPPINRVTCRLRELGLFREIITPDHDADHRDHVHLGLAPAASAPRVATLPDSTGSLLP